MSLEAIDNGEEVTVEAAWLALRHVAGPAVLARSVAALEHSTGKTFMSWAARGST